MRPYVILLVVFAFILCGCGNKDEQLREALRKDADWSTVKSLLDAGANPHSKGKDGRSAVDLAEAMLNRSKQRLREAKNDLVRKQLKGEVAHNAMTLNSLRRHRVP